MPRISLTARSSSKLIINPYLKEKQTEKLIDFLIDNVKQEFKIREKKLGKKLWIEVIKAIFLSTIDKYWMDHLTAIEDLREGINLRGYAQIDPLVAYKNEAYSMFEKLIGDINFEVSRRLLKVEVQGPVVEQKKQELPAVYKSASAVDPFTQKPSYAKASEGKEKLAQPVVSSHKKIGRNDPCWCGSGKKYKRCHYPN